MRCDRPCAAIAQVVAVPPDILAEMAWGAVRVVVGAIGSRGTASNRTDIGAIHCASSRHAVAVYVAPAFACAVGVNFAMQQQPNRCM